MTPHELLSPEEVWYIGGEPLNELDRNPCIGRFIRCDHGIEAAHQYPLHAPQNNDYS
jgi:hypothetical protein